MIRIFAALCLATLLHPALAQDYPARAVKIVVPFAAGGAGTPYHTAGELFKALAGVVKLSGAKADQ